MSNNIDKNNRTISATMPSPSSSIYINPKFKNAHINPNFLHKKPLITTTPSNIYVNPKFLSTNKIKELASLPHHSQHISSPTSASDHQVKATIITKTNRKLVRQPLQRPIDSKKMSPTRTPIVPLVKIGQRKLVRPTVATTTVSPSPKFSSKSNTKIPLRTKYKIVKVNGSDKPRSLYKIDRRSPKERPKRLVGRSSLSLRSVSFDESLTSTKVIITNHKLLRIGNLRPRAQLAASKTATFKAFPSTQHKKLSLLNINGVFYRSTKNKLQKHDSVAKSPAAPAAPKKPSNALNSRTLFVRGEKFILDVGGKKMRRVQSNEAVPMKRIDIGGLTYVARTNDIYERTDIHKTRGHLTAAKQRSIQMLSKGLFKSNVPCPIFRKLGKCRGFDSGRCKKVHDPKHVAICQKFLKGECNIEKCLLSHTVSLAKMPTCKFYLQGICAKSNCPYLHKKVNEKVEICLDFLRGFCEKAEKCNKRHEFLCSEYESKGRCERTRCPYPHRDKKEVKAKEKVEEMRIDSLEQTDDSPEKPSVERKRYFIDDEPITEQSNQPSDEAVEEDTAVAELSELGKIKLSRCINKIDKLKENLNLYAGTSTEISADAEPQSNNDVHYIPNKRPKLGKLPSFIPIN